MKKYTEEELKKLKREEEAAEAAAEAAAEELKKLEREEKEKREREEIEKKLFEEIEKELAEDRIEKEFTLYEIEEQGYELKNIKITADGIETEITKLEPEEIEVIFETLEDRDILFTKEGQKKAKTTKQRDAREYCITYQIETKEGKEFSILKIYKDSPEFEFYTNLEVIYLEA